MMRATILLNSVGRGVATHIDAGEHRGAISLNAVDS